jgi:hypothetical protein
VKFADLVLPQRRGAQGWQAGFTVADLKKNGAVALNDDELKKLIVRKSTWLALAMGLDKNDEIVKRRMAQKMQFLAEDAAAARVPTTAELRNWYAKNSDKFAMPKRVSFRHLFFSPARRATSARDDAIKALAQLAGQPADAKLPESFADPFMFHEYYRDRATDYLSKEFGPQFALEVAKLPIGSRQGPIESGFGWHLVFVDTAIPGRVPDFEEVEPEAKTAWLGEQKALAWERAYQDMRAKYTVLVPRPPENAEAAVHGRQSKPGLTARWPWVIAFAFGLLHGFGFAGALNEVGLPQNAIPVALLFFNLGVEVGQLLFVAAMLLVVGLGRKLARSFSVSPPPWAWRVPPYAMGSVAAFWLIQRIAAFGA